MKTSKHTNDLTEIQAKEWQKKLDEKRLVATVLIDLSKAYDSTPQDHKLN